MKILMIICLLIVSSYSFAKNNESTLSKILSYFGSDGGPDNVSYPSYPSYPSHSSYSSYPSYPSYPSFQEYQYPHDKSIEDSNRNKIKPRDYKSPGSVDKKGTRAKGV